MRIPAESSSKEKEDVKTEEEEDVVEEAVEDVEEEEQYYLYMPLVKSVFVNDWETAIRELRKYPGEGREIKGKGREFVSRAIISSCNDEVFLEELIDCALDFTNLEEVQLISPQVVLSGKLTTVKVFLDKVIASDSDGKILRGVINLLMYLVGIFSQKELGTYILYRANAYDLDNQNYWDDDDCLHCLHNILDAEHFGAAYHILKADHKLARMFLDDFYWYILQNLARKPRAFRSGSDFGVLEWFIYSCIQVNINDKSSYDIWSSTNGLVHVKVQPSRWNLIQTLVQKVNKIRDTKLMHLHAQAVLDLICREFDTIRYIDNYHAKKLKAAALTAAELGNYEVLIQVLKLYPPIIATSDDEEIFNFAVLLRHAKIFSLVYHSTAFMNVMINTSDNNPDPNILHRVAKLPDPSRLSGTGALLQMQREMQWFQITDSLILPTHRAAKVDVDGVLVTPRELFTIQHKELKEKAEKMVESTAQSGTIVAALIATVAFTAALTVPAGVNQDTGLPLLLGVPAFLIFAISDAMGFFSSITSVMAFTVVLTSPTTEEDFAFSLPLKLIMGLVSMSFSAACIIAAFCATLYIVLAHRMKLIVIPISILAVFPIAFFVFMQLPFLVELFITTFGKEHLPSPDKAPHLLVPQRLSSSTTLGFFRKLKLKFPFLKKSRQVNDVNDPKPSNV